MDNKQKKEPSTNELLEIMNKTKKSDLASCLEKYSDNFVGERIFTEYMRGLFEKKKIAQQDIFRKAEVPEKYGYRLISGERVTRQRDIILRLCISAGFTLKETQQALKYYRMPELYARFPRDAVLIIALNNKVRDVSEVDELLVARQMDKLTTCGREED